MAVGCRLSAVGKNGFQPSETIGNRQQEWLLETIGNHQKPPDKRQIQK